MTYHPTPAQGGDVFVLDMGEPVKIIDLARRMVELSGLTVRDEANPSGDIELAVTGLRPDEKHDEELLIGDNPQATQHPRIMKAQEQFVAWPELQVHLKALSLAVSANDVPAFAACCNNSSAAISPQARWWTGCIWRKSAGRRPLTFDVCLQG